MRQISKTSKQINAFADIVAGFLSLHNQAVDRVYHYTSAAAFLNILNTKEFWLTEHSYLRDYSEIAHGLKSLVEALDKRKGNQVVDLFYGGQSQLEKLALLTNLSYHTFIFSLSEDGDSKSQWSEYADDYRGVALGFDYDGFRSLLFEVQYAVNYTSDHLTKDYAERPIFSKVIYSDQDKLSLIEGILDRAIELSKALPKGTKKDDRVLRLRSIITDALFVVIKLISLFKNNSFEAEREHRIVMQYPMRGGMEIVSDLAAVDYRSRGNLIVPFHRLRLGHLEDLLTMVRVGPKYEDFKFIFTLGEVCQKHGFRKAKVEKSNIPIH